MKKVLLLMVTLTSLSFFMSSCSDPYEPTPDPTEMLGDVVFWTDANYSGGRINVTFRSATMTITRYYYDGIPSCGSQGCATYENVPIGTYSYHAENTRYVWNGEVTIREGRCTTWRLYVDKSGETGIMDETDGIEEIEPESRILE